MGIRSTEEETGMALEQQALQVLPPPNTSAMGWMPDIEGDWTCRQDGTTCSFNCKARDGKKCGGDIGEDSGIQACVPLWIFGSEIITLIDR